MRCPAQIGQNFTQNLRRRALARPCKPADHDQPRPERRRRHRRHASDHRRVSVQNPRHGRRQVRNHVVGPEGKSPVLSAVAGPNEHGSKSRTPAHFHVGGRVAHHPRRAPVDLQIAAGVVHHAGRGLPARAREFQFGDLAGKSAIGMMGTDVNPIDVGVARRRGDASDAYECASNLRTSRRHARRPTGS